MKFTDLPEDVQQLAKGDWGLQSPTEPLPGYFAEPEIDWMDLHDGFCDRARAGGVDVLFIGDSITEGWGKEGAEAWNQHFAPLRSVNLGIGGDRTQQLLWRIQHGTLKGIEPKLVVLLIGVNNLWPMTHSPSEVVDGISAVVSEIQGRLPRAQILLQGILPTGEAADGPYRGTIKSINSILAESDFGPSVRFINLGDLYLEADGTISAAVMPDFCHLSAEAYSVWANALIPHVRELLATNP